MSDQEPTGPFPPGGIAQPGPVAFEVTAIPTQDGGKMLVLRLEHTAGSTIVGLPADFAKDLANTLLKSATGLDLAKPSDIPKI